MGTPLHVATSSPLKKSNMTISTLKNALFYVGTKAAKTLFQRAVRVDADGNELWWRTYPDGTSNAVAVTSDGGFVIAGVSAVNGPEVPTVLRTDADGNLLWEANDIITRAPASHYTVHDTVGDGEGRIVLVGEATKVRYIGNTIPVISNEGYIMQLDSSGNLNWYKSLGSGFVSGVALTDSGNYITTGRTADTLQVIRVDTSGHVM